MSDHEYVRVRAVAGAKREQVQEHSPSLWHITVREKAEHGAANARIRELLASSLGVAVKQIHLVKGTKGPSKVYLVYR